MGAVAAAASWAHVVSLAVLHGQAGWLAVADAAVIETTAVSAGLEVRRRRRAGRSPAFVLAVLVVAVGLSLAAQVAEAERSVWGWTLAAIPAAGFLVLVKIALREVGDGRSTAEPEHDQRPGLGPAAGPGPEGGPADVQPAGDRRPEAERGPAAAAKGVVVPAGPLAALLPAGRAVRDDLARSGRPLSRSALSRELRSRGQRISNQRAADLLAVLAAENGHP